MHIYIPVLKLEFSSSRLLLEFLPFKHGFLSWIALCSYSEKNNLVSKGADNLGTPFEKQLVQCHFFLSAKVSILKNFSRYMMGNNALLF